MRRLPLGPHHTAAHTRVAALICVEPSNHSPYAHCSQACRTRGRTRCSCASLPLVRRHLPGPQHVPFCARARRCCSRGNGYREGAERAARSGGYAVVGESRTVRRVVEAFAPSGFWSRVRANS
eukprot:7376213-Prymnesium_polylepis.1